MYSYQPAYNGLGDYLGDEASGDATPEESGATKASGTAIMSERKVNKATPGFGTFLIVLGMTVGPIIIIAIISFIMSMRASMKKDEAKRKKRKRRKRKR